MRDGENSEISGLTHGSRSNLKDRSEIVLVDNAICHGVISQLVSRIKFDNVTVKNACQENPSKGDPHIISKNFINEESHIDVLNSNGIHLKFQISEVDNNHEILDLYSFAQGMYYIKTREDENTYLCKVVKLD